MVKQLQHSPLNKSRLQNTHAKHVGDMKITLYFPNKRVDNPKKMIIKMGELTFPTTRAEIVDFLEATYVSEEVRKRPGRVTPRTSATTDQKPLTTVLAFAVSDLFLP